ncbi:MAG: MarR family winged helix-turn-helix transcriptional regulator [Alphaproteobacteria bacterium]
MANKSNSLSSPKTRQALAFWQGVNVHALQYMPADLSARQTAVLLHVYLSKEPHGIKELSESLQISKPAICRAVDTLEKLKLVRRKPDRHDGRNILVMPTPKGHTYLGQFARIIMDISKKAA